MQTVGRTVPSVQFDLLASGNASDNTAASTQQIYIQLYLEPNFGKQ